MNAALRPAYVRGAGGTSFGRHEGRSALDLMDAAAAQAIESAGLARHQIDGVLCGYATTLPHLMLSTLVCERLALRPRYAHGLQLGGASGAAMLMAARELVRSGRCRNVLVLGGENRLSGQSRDSSIQTLAQVGDADFEVPNGASVPAYYALMASEYMQRTGVTSADLAEFAVLMRTNAADHPDAHLRTPVTLQEVLAAKPIASPLSLLDCCPISDGAMALVVSADPAAQGAVAMVGAGQAHRHQHLTAMEDVMQCGAGEAAQQAFAEARLGLGDVDYLGIYDSFTITLVMLLEEIGFAPRAGAAQRARAGEFAPTGPLPLNTHGGLLSFGHCGVAGGLAHTVEAWHQMTGQAGARQLKPPRRAFIHADGGVMSSHVSLILSRED
ncbi:thiolase family protein [Acidovorax sp.]|uniref:thiolase family protein n=1 Tax=Acidovorax sp. TaxID=1872122 RepID=UPI003BB0C6DD